MSLKYNVEGYKFETKEEAELARKELEAVKYMSEKTSNSSVKTARKIYDKIVSENLFSTPVGLDYLKALKEYLYMNGEFAEERKVREETAAAKESVQEAAQENAQEVLQESVQETEDPLKNLQRENRKVMGQNKKLKDLLYSSVGFNFILIIAIIVMIIIASTSSNVNILNYENKIQNKYSSWAEELKAKEAELKSREKAVEERESAVQEREDILNQ